MTAPESAEMHWAMGTLNEIVASQIAIQALQEGYDGPGLRELAWTHDSWRDAGVFWPQAVADMRLAPLPNPAAVRRVCRLLAGAIVTEQVEPVQGAAPFKHLLDHLEDFAPLYVGNLIAVRAMVDAYRDAECVDYMAEPEQAYATLVQSIQDIARNLLTTGLEPELASRAGPTGLEPTLATAADPTPPAPSSPSQRPWWRFWT